MSVCPDLWYCVQQEKQNFLKDGLITPRSANTGKAGSKARSRSRYDHFIEICYRIYIILAYLSLALSGTYSAIINLGLLHLPAVVYVSFVCLIGVASFASSIVDWVMTQIARPDRYPTEKIRSIENRFFLHSPKLQRLKLKSKAVPRALRRFAAYAYLEKLVRKQVKGSLVHDGQIYFDTIDGYPIELQARSILSERARSSRDHRHSIIDSAQALADSYGVLKDFMDGEGFESIWKCSNKCDPVQTDVNEIYRKVKHNTALKALMQDYQKNQSKPVDASKKSRVHESDHLNEVNEIDPGHIAAFTVLRFACFARTYYNELASSVKGKGLSEDELKSSLQTSLKYFIMKRIKKEQDLCYASREIGVVANIIVWGSAIITNTLTVVASAPIKLLSNWAGINIESLLCMWFYASGCLIGVSSENAKKFLARIVRHVHQSDHQNLAPFLKNKVFRFRLFLVVATALSTCYFSMFGIMRLINNPEEHGAAFIINFLSKQLIPQIWPFIIPIWTIFTLTSAMMNLYKDSKFYSACEQRFSACKFMVFRENIQSLKSHLFESKYIVKGALIGLLITLSLAIALSYHVTVMKLTNSIVFSAVLSSCVFCMNYAKYTSLYHKMRDLAVSRIEGGALRQHNWCNKADRKALNRNPAKQGSIHGKDKRVRANTK